MTYAYLELNNRMNKQEGHIWAKWEKNWYLRFEASNSDRVRPTLVRFVTVLDLNFNHFQSMSHIDTNESSSFPDKHA